MHSASRITRSFTRRCISSSSGLRSRHKIHSCAVRSLSSIHPNIAPYTSGNKLTARPGVASFSSAAIENDEPVDINLSTSSQSFDKILIANRGEIARRIIRTCKSLGIKTVAIYSTADSKSLHVQEADEAICVGPPASSDSYLSVPNIMKAIEQTNANAIHPGYGFLSENAEFAEQIEKAGKKFIGPSSSAIIAMGDKITSKHIASSAGVNIIPGFEGFVTSPEHAVEIAHQVGFPVMIKATSGGGGKGMRICYTDEEVKEGFSLSSAEAKKFFNDDRLFIEKYIEKPHHIEIQLLSGRNPETGELDILCFPERECSIQRRNQKVLEESPSTILKPETLKEMVRQVKMLVRDVEYESAGTVEFLVDEKQNFYFLEMNTRLQVEHPVTEMVSDGIDLVHGMIEVAAGKGIPREYMAKLGDQTGMSEEEKEGLSVPHHGYAIEARIYAEDPLRGFLPSTGPLNEYIEPIAGTEGDCTIRIDSGVAPGGIISQYYDPMISKLISHSSNDRKSAIDALKNAIDGYVISGVGNNTSFLTDVLRHDSFVAGDTPTNFIQTHYPEGFHGVALSSEEYAETAAMAVVANMIRSEVLQKPAAPMKVNDVDPFIVCLGGLFGKAYQVQGFEDALKVTSIGGEETHTVQLEEIDIDTRSPIVNVLVNDKKRVLQIEPEDSSGFFSIKYEGAQMDAIVMSPQEYEFAKYMNEPTKIDTSNLILSPMPGTLISYSVSDDTEVVEGQDICIVEAMKMQNVIRAPRSGKIKHLHAAVGASLMADEIIVEFAKDD